MGLTIVMYDGRGWERFRSPLRIGGTPGSRTLVADWPVPGGFTAHSYAVVDDAGDVVATGALLRAVDDGDTLGLPMPSISLS
jgi:hypothetical protein